jgi:two-component system response regulator MprA
MIATPAPTVLIVEDEWSVRALLSDVLRLEGYQVLGAEDGLQAVRLLDDQILPSAQPCTILLDMTLPHLDGLGVLHHLREENAHLPVVAMSANRAALEAAGAAGAEATLAKPFSLDRLVDTVARHSSVAA